MAATSSSTAVTQESPYPAEDNPTGNSEVTRWYKELKKAYDDEAEKWPLLNREQWKKNVAKYIKVSKRIGKSNTSFIDVKVARGDWVAWTMARVLWSLEFPGPIDFEKSTTLEQNIQEEWVEDESVWTDHLPLNWPIPKTKMLPLLSRVIRIIHKNLIEATPDSKGVCITSDIIRQVKGLRSPVVDSPDLNFRDKMVQAIETIIDQRHPDITDLDVVTAVAYHTAEKWFDEYDEESRLVQSCQSFGKREKMLAFDVMWNVREVLDGKRPWIVYKPPQSLEPEQSRQSEPAVRVEHTEENPQPTAGSQEGQIVSPAPVIAAPVATPVAVPFHQQEDSLNYLAEQRHKIGTAMEIQKDAVRAILHGCRDTLDSIAQDMRRQQEELDQLIRRYTDLIPPAAAVIASAPVSSILGPKSISVKVY
ncbi:hypothetical protein CP532_6814 [Ophiocordyceps camponoti-leonardi (nom. inval.)]|nr:hypothetical protein CP532_6814 [Ophiocordyceps camponoti-leonardi (nom. inval.)]